MSVFKYIITLPYLTIKIKIINLSQSRLLAYIIITLSLLDTT